MRPLPLNASLSSRLAHVALDLNLSTQECLTLLTRGSASLLDNGIGVQAVIYEQGKDGFQATRRAFHESPSSLASYVDRLPQSLSPCAHGQVARLRPGLYAYSQTSVGQKETRVFKGAAFDAVTRGIQDWIGVVSPMPGAFLVLAGFSARSVRPSAHRRRLWRDVAPVLGAGLALRLALQRPNPPSSAAVFHPSGALEHAQGAVHEQAGLRQRLRRAVRKRERAFCRSSKTSPPESELWPGLVDGRYALVDRFDSDGRRYVVGLRCPGDGSCPDRLTPRQKQILPLLQEGASNQQIANSLGCSNSTVATQVSLILAKFGLRRREMLLRPLLNFERRSNRVEVNGRQLLYESFRINPRPPLQLPIALHQIAEGIMAGLSNAELAETRGSTLGTISKQVHNLFKRLNVKDRAGLILKMSSGDLPLPHDSIDHSLTQDPP